MNQYRCETCGYRKPPLTGFCKTSQLCEKLGMHFEYPITGSGNEMWVLTEVGCASHSDFNPQAEREKVLDELVSWIEKGECSIDIFYRTQDGRELEAVGIETEGLLKKIAELRQGKDGE
jgi:hypothetical protein